jgi:hypothetical protein
MNIEIPKPSAYRPREFPTPVDPDPVDQGLGTLRNESWYLYLHVSDGFGQELLNFYSWTDIQA